MRPYGSVTSRTSTSMKLRCRDFLCCSDSRQPGSNLGLASPAKSPCNGLGWAEGMSRSRKPDYAPIRGS